MIRKILSSILLAATVTVSAQTERFSVATLNVDGLPRKILFLNINADGPGPEGSLHIGQYLAGKDYDLVFTQEDFNYHAELTLPLQCGYHFDTWSGGISLLGKKIDLLHLQNLRFDCDGLGAAWKKGTCVESVSRTAWNDVFGKFSHANDELATKGFRRYELKLPSGLQLVAYNLHMDAGDDTDEKNGNDLGDRMARRGEWRQLLDDLLPRLDERPVVIVGDMNSYYCRDGIEQDFIGVINATGIATAHDVWVDLVKRGIYPAPVDDIAYSEAGGYELDGETLDKIIYINPVDGIQIKPLECSIDTEGYLHDGKPLGDHYPLAATFEVTCDLSGGTSGMEAVATGTTTARELYDLSGRRVVGSARKGLYIEHQGGKTMRKRVIK